MEDPEDNKMHDQLEDKKDNELLALAQKYARDTDKSTACLPRKGIVKLVFENCPTWKKLYGKNDPRGAGMSIGRRIAKLNIPYEASMINEVEKLVVMLRRLANPTRLGLFFELRKGSRTWTDLMFDFRLNPKSLQDHLRTMKTVGLVQKTGKKGYELTAIGYGVGETLDSMMALTSKKREMPTLNKVR